MAPGAADLNYSESRWPIGVLEIYRNIEVVRAMSDRLARSAPELRQAVRSPEERLV
jgi:hypothetical protein